MTAGPPTPLLPRARRRQQHMVYTFRVGSARRIPCEALTAPGRMTPRLQGRPRKTAHHATMIIVHPLVTKRAGVCEATPRAAAIDGLTDSGSEAVTVDHAASARTDRSLLWQRPIRTGKSVGSHPHAQFRCQQYGCTCRSKSQGTQSPERGNSTGPSESADERIPRTRQP
jgi:hypothetical protein